MTLSDRDIKPHNFVLNTQGRPLLIDFGSAAPLLPPGTDGSQIVPKKYCLVPCGTCDYISPEILRCHEEALVALEMEDSMNEPSSIGEYDPGGYGRETDWWSAGAMFYEMIYGVAPFFAEEIRQTYLKIVDHCVSGVVNFFHVDFDTYNSTEEPQIQIFRSRFFGSARSHPTVMISSHSVLNV